MARIILDTAEGMDRKPASWRAIRQEAAHSDDAGPAALPAAAEGSPLATAGLGSLKQFPVGTRNVPSPVLFADPYMPRVSVVIPALNEEKNLPAVLWAIPSWVHEVLLVDGRSIDRTVEVARRMRPDIRVIAQPGKGKGDALRAGFAAAKGDIIVMLDADGSTRPEEMPAFVGALLAGADYAKGSRFMQGGGTADMALFRRVGHGMLVRLVKIAFGGNFSDLCYGYNAFWAHVLPRLGLDADGFEIETMMNVRALRARLKVVEVHSYEERRTFGEGRLRAIPDGLRVLRTIVKERLGLGSPVRVLGPVGPKSPGRARPRWLDDVGNLASRQASGE